MPCWLEIGYSERKKPKKGLREKKRLVRAILKNTEIAEKFIRTINNRSFLPKFTDSLHIALSTLFKSFFENYEKHEWFIFFKVVWNM